MDFIKIILAAIDRVREPRLFDTERGYQGQLKSEIDRLIHGRGDFCDPLVEEEYQKTLPAHGITLRPDIIIHIPFDRGVSPTRRDDNFVVISLKLSANKTKAEESFNDLEKICSTLKYPLGVFVNVASSNLWLPDYKPKENRIFELCEIAVQSVDGRPVTKTTSLPAACDSDKLTNNTRRKQNFESKKMGLQPTQLS